MVAQNQHFCRLVMLKNAKLMYDFEGVHPLIGCYEYSLLFSFVGLLHWCVSSVIFGTVNENRGHVNSVKLDAFINSISKTAWSFGLAWIIFACNTGYGGFVNTFLSSGLCGPFGRLNYCAYLIHPILMYVFILNQRYSFYFSDINMIFLFLGHWLATYVLAFFISMAFEAPMIGLERLLLPRTRK